MSKELPRLSAFLLILAIALSAVSGLSVQHVQSAPAPDNLVEGNETVALTLGDSGSYDVGANRTATVTIADNPFLGVAAGDADASSAVLWTRINRAQSVSVTAQVSTDPGFVGTSLTFTGASDATKDFTLKITTWRLSAMGGLGRK